MSSTRSLGICWEKLTSCPRAMNGIVHPLSMRIMVGFSCPASSSCVYWFCRSSEMNEPASTSRLMFSGRPFSRRTCCAWSAMPASRSSAANWTVTSPSGTSVEICSPSLPPPSFVTQPAMPTAIPDAPAAFTKVRRETLDRRFLSCESVSTITVWSLSTRLIYTFGKCYYHRCSEFSVTTPSRENNSDFRRNYPRFKPVLSEYLSCTCDALARLTNLSPRTNLVLTRRRGRGPGAQSLPGAGHRGVFGASMRAIWSSDSETSRAPRSSRSTSTRLRRRTL